MNHAMTAPTFAVAALYRFTPLPDCAALVAPLAAAARANGIKGTLLLAPEGINGTIAGPAAGMAAMLATLRALPGCAALEVKHASADAMPFHRLKVRVKREIVTMGQPDIDPLAAGSYVAPEDWNDFIRQPGTILIDTRNDYEVAIGSFAGAIDPQTPSFRDFPAWFRARRAELFAGDTPPRVAMFCTGGIRCEKAAPAMMKAGFREVYQLDGGILKYFEECGGAHYEGECFVFDKRVALNPDLEPSGTAQCFACQSVLSLADQASKDYIHGEQCPHCVGRSVKMRNAALRSTAHQGL